MLSTQQALDKILALMHLTDTETIPLRRANGRILAQSAIATRDQPPFHSSAMDGYAVISADIHPGAKLTVIGQSQAGKSFDGTITNGQTVRIFTGAPVPNGADRILIQEDATRDGQTITIRENADPSPHIRRQGSDFKIGHTVHAPNRLTPADIGLLAAMNFPTVQARKKPVVAIITTGDELVLPGETPTPDQIFSSNGLSIAALLEQHGAKTHLLPIARDTKDSLQTALDLAKGADLILTIGGASVGDHDLVQATATDAGLKLDFWKVAMRPGKPLIAGLLNQTPFIGLPGNPVSAMVCAHIFLRPALDVMLGLPAGPLPRLRGHLTQPIESTGPREHYLRTTATQTNHGWQLTPAPRQDSSLMSILAQSNALIIAPPNQPALPAHAESSFILL